MASSNWLVTGCVGVAVALLIGCTTLPSVLGHKDVKPLNKLIGSNTESIQLVFVHGVGDHCPKYALNPNTGWLKDETLKYLGLTPVDNGGAKEYVSNASNLTANNGTATTKDTTSQMVYQVKDYTLAIPGGKQAMPVHAVAITWSALTSWIKSSQLGYDSPTAIPASQDSVHNPDCVAALPHEVGADNMPTKRVWINRALKEGLLDRKLSDAVLYSGTYGKIIQRGVADVLCHVSTGDYADKQCVWPQDVPESLSKMQYIFVTHSLGSRIVFDTLLNLRNYDGVEAANHVALKGLIASTDSDAEMLPSPFHRWFAKNSNPSKLTNHIIEKTAGIYMMANQVSLIGLSQIEHSVNSADTEQPNLIDLPQQVTAMNGVVSSTRVSTCKSIITQYGAVRADLIGLHSGLSTKGANGLVASGADELRIVAFNDTNDLLNWHIPPWYGDAGKDQEHCDSHVDLVNVFVPNATPILIFEDPAVAHSGYFHTKDVWQAMVCGATNGTIDRCL